MRGIAVGVVWAPARDSPRSLHTLSPSEATRAARYSRAQDRAAFVTGATLVREAAARATGLPASAARIDRTCPRCGADHGPPVAVDAPDLALSVTHAGGMVGVAATIAGGVRLGLDVEPVGDAPSAELLGTACAPRERAAVRGSADPAREFARLWTRKEALLKARGVGLMTAPETVDVSDQRAGVPEGRWLTVGGPGDGFVSALFAAGAGGRAVVVVETRVNLDPGRGTPVWEALRPLPTGSLS